MAAARILRLKVQPGIRKTVGGVSVVAKRHLLSFQSNTLAGFPGVASATVCHGPFIIGWKKSFPQAGRGLGFSRSIGALLKLPLCQALNYDPRNLLLLQSGRKASLTCARRAAW